MLFWRRGHRPASWSLLLTGRNTNRLLRWQRAGGEVGCLRMNGCDPGVTPLAGPARQESFLASDPRPNRRAFFSSNSSGCDFSALFFFFAFGDRYVQKWANMGRKLLASKSRILPPLGLTLRGGQVCACHRRQRSLTGPSRDIWRPSRGRTESRPSPDRAWRTCPPGTVRLLHVERPPSPAPLSPPFLPSLHSSSPPLLQSWQILKAQAENGGGRPP